MGIQIGGGGFDVSPFLAFQRQQQEDLQRAQDRADAANMQSATHTANIGAANFQYHDQQQHEHEALARHAADVARQQTENTQHQAAFDRAGQFHNDQMKQDQDRLAQTAKIHADSLAENERVRNANLAERTQRDNTLAGFHDDAESRRLAENEAAPWLKQSEISLHEASRLRLSGAPDDADMAQAHAEMMRAKAKEAHDAIMNERQPWNQAAPPPPDLLNPQFALPSEAVPATSGPEFPTGTDEQAMDNPPWNPPSGIEPSIQNPGSSQMAQRRFDAAQAKAAKVKADADKEARIKANQDRNFGNKIDQQNVYELAHHLRKQVMPLLAKADPYDAYEFAKTSGQRLPPGNPFQDADMAELADYARRQIQLGQMEPNTTPEMVWAREHRGTHHPQELIAAARAILTATLPTATPEPTQAPPARGSNAVFAPPEEQPVIGPRRTEAAAPIQQPRGVTAAAPGAAPVNKDRAAIVEQQRNNEISNMPRQTPQDRLEHDFAGKVHTASDEALRGMDGQAEANSWQDRIIRAERKARELTQGPLKVPPAARPGDADFKPTGTAPAPTPQRERERNTTAVTPAQPGATPVGRPKTIVRNGKTFDLKPDGTGYIER